MGRLLRTFVKGVPVNPGIADVLRAAGAHDPPLGADQVTEREVRADSGLGSEKALAH